MRPRRAARATPRTYEPRPRRGLRSLAALATVFALLTLAAGFPALRLLALAAGVGLLWVLAARGREAEPAPRAVLAAGVVAALLLVAVTVWHLGAEGLDVAGAYVLATAVLALAALDTVRRPLPRKRSRRRPGSLFW